MWEPEPYLDGISLSQDGNGASESLGPSAHLLEQSSHIGWNGTAPVVALSCSKFCIKNIESIIVLFFPPHHTQPNISILFALNEEFPENPTLL